MCIALHMGQWNCAGGAVPPHVACAFPGSANGRRVAWAVGAGPFLHVSLKSTGDKIQMNTVDVVQRRLCRTRREYPARNHALHCLSKTRLLYSEGYNKYNQAQIDRLLALTSGSTSDIKFIKY